ncbi:hypothetical protein F5Y14DRAFT_124343 [Nemania sp. NC0429]|nr:hypothetical protein F5Y14DRAFT_124343 [Nemania sp. NC0429]
MAYGLEGGAGLYLHTCLIPDPSVGLPVSDQRPSTTQPRPSKQVARQRMGQVRAPGTLHNDRKRSAFHLAAGRLGTLLTEQTTQTPVYLATGEWITDDACEDWCHYGRWVGRTEVGASCCTLSAAGENPRHASRSTQSRNRTARRIDDTYLPRHLPWMDGYVGKKAVSGNDIISNLRYAHGAWFPQAVQAVLDSRCFLGEVSG